MVSQSAPTAQSVEQDHINPAPHHLMTHRLIVLGLLLAGFFLRLMHLGAESLWYDETVSVYLASQSVSELIAHTARDIHPPAYYLLLQLWHAISHPSVAFGLEFLYAWPSVWLDLVVMALTYAIAKYVMDARAARWALALAAIQPTQFWFAQEVRMYALGACCLMLTLWAVLPLLTDREATSPLDARLPWRTRLLYPITALLGLYTLYYFLFWLITLNIGVFIRLWRYGRRLRGWLLLQCIVTLGWLPWLPTFVRQAIDPPVPTWRVPWQSYTEVAHALSEALAGIWTGHTVPLEVTWPWALFIIVLAIVFYFYAKLSRQLRIIWLLLTFGPLLLLFAVSLLGPPIYHVRYVATYAPVYVVLVAAFIASRPWAVKYPTALLLLALSSLAIRQLLTDPRFAADDHRAAVATLAQQWRPGDAILVNAGWVYTALAVYWPHELATPDASRPPALAATARLTPQAVNRGDTLHAQPMLYRTGSVNGEPTLGWNLPESDFFAISADDTLTALEMLAQQSGRIWHYRLYDTVNDPQGIIRQWLHDNTAQIYARDIPGRDFLRLEAYRPTNPSLPTPEQTVWASIPAAELTLTGVDLPRVSPAGETLFAFLAWERTSNTAAPQVALSLRLYDTRGIVMAQHDEPLTIDSAPTSRQSLALPLPADLVPGDYQVGLVIYAPQDLAPYPLVLPDGTQTADKLLLGYVTIELPQAVPHVSTIQATFDYIDLVQSQLPAGPVQPGAPTQLELTWRPRANSYRDHYRGRLELVNDGEEMIQLGEFDLGAPGYPSSVWQAAFPVRQREFPELPLSLANSQYTVRLTVIRASDGQVIPARVPWQWRERATLDLGIIQLQTPD